MISNVLLAANLFFFFVEETMGVAFNNPTQDSLWKLILMILSTYLKEAFLASRGIFPLCWAPSQIRRVGTTVGEEIIKDILINEDLSFSGLMISNVLLAANLFFFFVEETMGVAFNNPTQDSLWKLILMILSTFVIPLFRVVWTVPLLWPLTILWWFVEPIYYSQKIFQEVRSPL